MAGIAVAALGLSTAAVVVALDTPYSSRAVVAVIHALLIATPLLVGLYSWRRDSESRFARLLVAAGFLWAPSLLAASDRPALYSVGRLAGWIVVLSVILLLLAFPTGRLNGRAERLVAFSAVALVPLLIVPSVLLIDHYPTPTPWSACVQDCPHNALAVTHPEPGFMSSVVNPLRDGGAALLFVFVAVILGRKLALASRPMRRTLAPALGGAVVVLIADAAFVIARQVSEHSAAAQAFGYVLGLAIPILVLLFLAGLIIWRFIAANAFRELSGEFHDATSGARLRDLIAHAVGDPSLEIAYWTGQPGHWVNQSGMPVALPKDDPARAVTEIKSDGRTVAALVHDAALGSEPNVREVAGGFALMALENLRLGAELHSSLRELRESRARILTAVDLERQRIERDLHDGAQQRLVALRVALEVAGEVMPRDPGTAAEMLRTLGADVEATLDEVRSLARGVYPPLLADHGIGEALRMVARSSPLQVTVRSRRIGRYSQQIESAVYFCCLEALQNAAKHSGARAATITLTEDDELHFVVQDDGHGFPVVQRRGGAGLDNMRDRIVSLGGRLTIESEPGTGTRVVGSVPVGLAQLTPDVAMLLQRATDAFDDCFGIYRAVRDSSGEVVDFAVEHVNDAACRDTGRARETQIGRTLGYLDPDYLDSELFAWERQALDADGPSLLDDVLYERRAEGRQLSKAYEVRAVPMGGGRLAVTWRDITERKRREDELLLNSTVLDRMPIGVCLIRASDGEVVYSNPRFDGDPWNAAHVVAFDHPDHGEVWVAVALPSEGGQPSPGTPGSILAGGD